MNNKTKGILLISPMMLATIYMFYLMPEMLSFLGALIVAFMFIIGIILLTTKEDKKWTIK